MYVDHVSGSPEDPVPIQAAHTGADVSPPATLDAVPASISGTNAIQVGDAAASEGGASGTNYESKSGFEMCFAIGTQH